MRFIRALNTSIAVFFAQTFALAIAEGFGGMHVDPFHSRKALFYVVLGVSVAAAVLRWKMSGNRAASPRSEASRPAAASAPAHRAPASGLPGAQPDQSATGARAEDMQAARSTPADRRSAEMLAAAGRQAILFRQYFPPPHDPAIRSFFGGAPIAPRGFAWPRSDPKGAPLHFLLQVDCAAVPATARLGALPASGVLYFFLDLEWGTTFAARVMHADAEQDGWDTVKVPDDLGPVFGKEAPHSWAWAQSKEQCPALLPKWPFEPVAIEVPENVEDEQDEESPALWRGAASEIRQAHGDEVFYNGISMADVRDGNSLRRPFPSFPHDWRAVQICSAQLVERAERERRYPQMSVLRDMDKETRDALVGGISSEAQAWFDRATSKDAFDEVPEPDRSAFWEFLDRHASLSRFMLPEALTLSIESSLAESARAAARIPVEIAERVRARHALAVTTTSGVHTNIPDRMLAPPVDVQGNQWERAQTHLLLLEISSNDGLGHRFGEGVYQFWITPEDLIARRFERVELTADAY